MRAQTHGARATRTAVHQRRTAMAPPNLRVLQKCSATNASSNAPTCADAPVPTEAVSVRCTGLTVPACVSQRACKAFHGFCDTAQVLTQQSHKVCRTCLYAAQQARVAQALRTERLIVEGDRVLLALSGGARVLLYCFHACITTLGIPSSLRHSQATWIPANEDAGLHHGPPSGGSAPSL